MFAKHQGGFGIPSMSLPNTLFTLRVLIRDTLAQARSSGITWGLLAITLVSSLFCLSIDVTGDVKPLPTQPWERPELIPKSEADRLNMNPDQVRGEGVDVPTGDLRLFFGSIRIPLQRTRSESVKFVQMVLAGGLADTAGLLLCLLWTASFLPHFLEPTTASVLLAKPAARWMLLLGKAAGVIVAVGLQALLFVSATWLTLGFRTGVWDVSYFLAVPILLVHFSVFLSVSALIAVLTRSTVACALGTLIVWLVCFGVNIARHEGAMTSNTNPPRAATALEIAYWVLPKPADFNLILADTLGADRIVPKATDYQQLELRGGFAAEWSLATGVLFAAALFGLAGRQLAKTDY